MDFSLYICLEITNTLLIIPCSDERKLSDPSNFVEDVIYNLSNLSNHVLSDCYNSWKDFFNLQTFPTLWETN